MLSLFERVYRRYGLKQFTVVSAREEGRTGSKLIASYPNLCCLFRRSFYPWYSSFRPNDVQRIERTMTFWGNMARILFRYYMQERNPNATKEEWKVSIILHKYPPPCPHPLNAEDSFEGITAQYSVCREVAPKKRLAFVCRGEEIDRGEYFARVSVFFFCFTM